MFTRDQGLKIDRQNKVFTVNFTDKINAERVASRQQALASALKTRIKKGKKKQADRADFLRLLKSFRAGVEGPNEIINSYRRCRIIKSAEVFVKERIIQFLYASLVPCHYRFASLPFVPVPPPRSTVRLDRVKNYATNFYIFKNHRQRGVYGALNEKAGPTGGKGDSFSIFMIWLIIIPCLRRFPRTFRGIPDLFTVHDVIFIIHD